MLQLKPQARMEMVTCIEGSMSTNDVIPSAIFIRGNRNVVENTLPLRGLVKYVEALRSQFGDSLEATLLIHCMGGSALSAHDHEQIIKTLGPSKVQAFGVKAGSAAFNTFVSAGHRITTPDAWFGSHAGQHRETKKVSYYDRIEHMAWWAERFEKTEDPALRARIRSEVLKDNWNDDLDDLPIVLTGAELAALGETQLVHDVWLMHGIFNGFLPEAAQDPMVRGFWERAYP